MVKRILALTAIVAALSPAAAGADSVPKPDPFAQYSDPNGVVLAIETPVESRESPVRLIVYSGEASFLESAAAKHWAEVNEAGAAIVRLGDMPAGDYAFVAYIDENGDGKLNRGLFGAGKPTEPYAFSNGVRPKLRKPKFEEAKVGVGPGSIVVISIED